MQPRLSDQPRQAFALQRHARIMVRELCDVLISSVPEISRRQILASVTFRFSGNAQTMMNQCRTIRCDSSDHRNEIPHRLQINEMKSQSILNLSVLWRLTDHVRSNTASIFNEQAMVGVIW